VLEKIKDFVQIFANLAGIAAFVLAIIVFRNPQTVSEYLDEVAEASQRTADGVGRIADNTGAIAGDTGVLATAAVPEPTLYLSLISEDDSEHPTDCTSPCVYSVEAANYESGFPIKNVLVKFLDSSGRVQFSGELGDAGANDGAWDIFRFEADISAVCLVYEHPRTNELMAVYRRALRYDANNEMRFTGTRSGTLNELRACQ